MNASPDPQWRCGTHGNPYNACWACMIEAHAKSRTEERKRALEDAVFAVQKIVTGHSAVRKTVVAQAVEAIQSLQATVASTRNNKP